MLILTFKLKDCKLNTICLLNVCIVLYVSEHFLVLFYEVFGVKNTSGKSITENKTSNSSTKSLTLPSSFILEIEILVKIIMFTIPITLYDLSLMISNKSLGWMQLIAERHFADKIK